MRNISETIRFEPGIDLVGLLDAAEKQRSRHEQEKRQRDLRHQERVRDSHPPQASSRGSRFLKYSRDTRMRHAERGNEPEDGPRRHGHDECKEQDGSVKPRRREDAGRRQGFREELHARETQSATLCRR